MLPGTIDPLISQYIGNELAFSWEGDDLELLQKQLNLPRFKKVIENEELIKLAKEDKKYLKLKNLKRTGFDIGMTY